MSIGSIPVAALGASMFVALAVAAACSSTDRLASRDAVRAGTIEATKQAAPSDVDPKSNASSEHLTLQCRLVDPRTGIGVPGVRAVVSLVTYPDPPAPNVRRTMKKTVLADRVSTVSGGVSVDVDLDAFATSRCLLEAWSRDWAGYAAFVLEDLETDGDVDSSVEVPVHPRTGVLRLRTVNGAGEPVPGCTVLVLPAWGDWQTMHAWYHWPALECEELIAALGLLATTGPSGEITMARVPVCEADPYAGYFASAFDQLHASRKELFGEPVPEYGELPVVEIPVERIADLWLAGVVVDTSGAAIPGASIFANGVAVAEAGPDGAWRAEGPQLGAGPWTFDVRANGYEPFTFTLPRPEYLLLDDARNARLVLEAESE